LLSQQEHWWYKILKKEIFMVNTTARFAAHMSDELHAIRQVESGKLSPADQQIFAQALSNPPAPAPALQRAFERRKKLLIVE
jgi:uncharacterized protein (DUF1778 family)